METQMNTTLKMHKAFFAVKRKPDNPSLAPRLIAIAESYDDAVRIADERNQMMKDVHEPYYPTIHHA
jgi:hypothetical protein